MLVHDSINMLVHDSINMFMHDSINMLVHDSINMFVHDSINMFVHDSINMFMHHSINMLLLSSPCLNDNVGLWNIDGGVPHLGQTDTIYQGIHSKRPQNPRSFALRGGTIDVRNSQNSRILHADNGVNQPTD